MAVGEDAEAQKNFFFIKGIQMHFFSFFHKQGRKGHRHLC